MAADLEHNQLLIEQEKTPLPLVRTCFSDIIKNKGLQISSLISGPNISSEELVKPAIIKASMMQIAG